MSCHIGCMTDDHKPDASNTAQPEIVPLSPKESVKPKMPPKMPKEIGGPKGPEPTRYGDWEVGGRCTDF
jgi:hypothetical protein